MMAPSLDPAILLLAYESTEEPGGQNLLAPEIAALAAAAGSRLYCPFQPSSGLRRACAKLGVEIVDEVLSGGAPTADALYLGTPTIVGDAPLFGTPTGPYPTEGWTKAAERRLVRRYVEACAAEPCYRRIITGLGTGDISVEERQQDMGGATLVCLKRFPGFADYVLVRDLPPMLKENR
jgi:hypothetical protein